MRVVLYSDGLVNPKVQQLILALGKQGHYAVVLPLRFLLTKKEKDEY